MISNEFQNEFRIELKRVYGIEKPLTVCIVIPTYNEKENIESLLDKIFENEKRYSKEKNVLLIVLVVDDNSPDGTSEIVKNYKKKNPKVFLYSREKKEGLGAAYISGMKYAINNFEPDVLFEMDADHSHDPDDIFRMIDEIKNGYDFVIGSRYVDGGKTPENWGIHRKFLSGFANLVTKTGLGISGIKDCSGGFRAIKTDVLKKINLDKLDVKGYAFQIALLEAAVYEKFKVKEIPISFGERNSGSSKMRFKDMLEGWKIIFKTRLKRFKSK